MDFSNVTFDDIKDVLYRTDEGKKLLRFIERRHRTRRSVKKWLNSPAPYVYDAKGEDVTITLAGLVANAEFEHVKSFYLAEGIVDIFVNLMQVYDHFQEVQKEMVSQLEKVCDQDQLLDLAWEIVTNTKKGESKVIQIGTVAKLEFIRNEDGFLLCLYVHGLEPDRHFENANSMIKARSIAIEPTRSQGH